MCGIIIQLSFGKNLPEANLLKRMLSEIQHRGPDSSGTLIKGWVGLGFNRLSIIDLSKIANQPMIDESGQYIIVFNGELYNFREIRTELTKKGYQFFSNSDTEVVMKSYIEWGKDSVNRFEGMFAFCVYDISKEKVFVARDHMGIKPLYFTSKDNNYFFSSEIKSFIHTKRLELNETVLNEHFKFGYVAGEKTLFKNIIRIESGTIVEISKDGRIKKEKYYKVSKNFVNTSNYIPDLELIEKKLYESFYQHTISDVGYNVQLSGGLDSSLVTAVLSKHLKSNLRTYSLTLDGEEYDEKHFQDIVVKQFKTKHFSIDVTNSTYSKLLEKATWHMDLPIVHSGCPFLMYLCKFSKETSKVIITGEGADELFGGYSRYNLDFQKKIAFFIKKYNLPIKFLPNNVPKVKGLKKILEMDPGIDDHVLKSDAQKVLQTQFENLSYRKNKVSGVKDLINKIFVTDQEVYLSTLLERQDKMSMAYSVESRVPYTNFKLFDLLNLINYKYKIKPNPKTLLKKIASKYFDNSFINRRKNGLRLPINNWLKSKKDLGNFLSLLTDKSFKERGFYKPKVVSNFVDEHISSKKNRTNELFTLIKFEIWYRKFIKN